MGSFRILPNSRARLHVPYAHDLQEILSLARSREVERDIIEWPAYSATPLRSIPTLASELGIGGLWYKDESERFGLGSFKALGSAYGVLRVLQHYLVAEHVTPPPGGASLLAGEFGDALSGVTLTCATDGNHGRAVAWAAERAGCACVVYLPAAVSEARARAIAGHGAEIVRVDGTYDDALEKVETGAAQWGRIVVSDTAYPGYEDVPRDIMQGYTVLVAETLRQLPGDTRITHAFVQAGVGGLAAAVCAHLWEVYGEQRPRVVVVEPETAACVFASAEAGHPTKIDGSLETVMGCLSAGAVSLLAWPVLERGVDAFVAIEDAAVDRALARVASLATVEERPSVGPSGCAGLAALLEVAGDPDARMVLDLDGLANVLVIGTEAAVTAPNN